jgi:hypothetical protein
MAEQKEETRESQNIKDRQKIKVHTKQKIC